MGWANANYAFKKKITIQNGEVAGDETDFPVLVSVTDADFKDEANGGHVQNANGYDIVFYDATEAVLLDHEIEYYLNTSGKLVFWVKIPSIASAADTDFYIYYGRAGIGANPSTTDTWDTEYMMVYHLSTWNDSTANAETLTPHNGASIIGFAAGRPMWAYAYFEKGNLEYAECNHIFDISTKSEITIEAWNYVESNSERAGVLLGDTAYIDVNGEGAIALRTRSTGKRQGGIWAKEGGVEHYRNAIEAAGTPIQTWYKHTTTVTNTDSYLYENAIEQAHNNSVLNNPTIDMVLANEIYLAADLGQPVDNRYYDGYLEEVRISDTIRSTNYLTTTFNSQDDPASFMVWGAEEEGPALSGTICAVFYITSETSAATLIKPLWNSIDNKIGKDIDRKSFWSGNYEINDDGITEQSVILQGIDKTYYFQNILDMEDNNEEITITNLGDCTNGVYIIKQFTFKTIKGVPDWFSWTLVLEKVRDS